MGKKKVTTYSITSGLKNLINKYLKITGMSATELYEKAIYSLYESDDRHIMGKLLVTQKSHPDYVKCDFYERVYVDDDMLKMINEIAAYNNNCSNSVVFFFAVLTYISRGLSKNILSYKGVKTGDTVLYHSMNNSMYFGKEAIAIAFDLESRSLSIRFEDGKIMIVDWKDIVVS